MRECVKAFWMQEIDSWNQEEPYYQVQAPYVLLRWKIKWYGKKRPTRPDSGTIRWVCRRCKFDHDCLPQFLILSWQIKEFLRNRCYPFFRCCLGRSIFFTRGGMLWSFDPSLDCQQLRRRLSHHNNGEFKKIYNTTFLWHFPNCRHSRSSRLVWPTLSSTTFVKE